MNKSLYFFIILCLVGFGLIYLSNIFLDTEALLYSFYSEIYTQEQIELLIKNQKKWSWLAYASIPLVTILRSILVALCLNIGIFFYDMENKISFNKFFKIALSGEFILILVGYAKFGYFYFIKTNYTLLDVQKYYPLSYTNFLDLDKIEPWLVYPLQTINIFEITYFFVLVYGMHKLLKSKYSKSFEITAISYGTGLTIWIGLVMFLTLNFT